MRAIRTAYGARVEQGDSVLSKLLSRPGPTHSLLDVVAATAVALTPDGRLGLLGFAGGGLIAPLRGAGFAGTVHAVDLDLRCVPLFRELSAAWCGDVRIESGEASAWLRRRRTCYDVLIEDLSVVDGRGVTHKPAVSYGALPALIRRRLRPGGVAITNLLLGSGERWADAIAEVARPFRRSATILFESYDNRLVVGADRLPPARELSRRLRAVLQGCGSRARHGLSVRTLR